MAGVKGKSGGVRAGAGRKAKPKPKPPEPLPLPLLPDMPRGGRSQ